MESSRSIPKFLKPVWKFRSFFSRICAHTVRLIKKLSENSVTFNSPCAAPFLCAVRPKVMWRYSPVTVILHQQHQHQTLELFGNQDWVLATRTVEHFLGEHSIPGLYIDTYNWWMMYHDTGQNNVNVGNTSIKRSAWSNFAFNMNLAFWIPI